MKESYPDLTMEDIQAWVGQASYRKGDSYFHQGAIIEPRQQGMMLKAHCLGSSAPSYRVQATLDEEGIAEANCSCPVGAGSQCKHIAALLLTWLNNPEAFEENADLETSLEQRSKPELIVLIRQMLQRYPELEYLLELPSPAAATSQADINPKIIRHQVTQAFARSGDDWGWRDLFEAAGDQSELWSNPAYAEYYLTHLRHDISARVEFLTPGAQAVPYGVIDTRGKYSIVFVPPCSLMVFLPPLHNQLSNEQGENSCKPFRMNRFRRLDYSRSSKRFAGNKWSLFGCADKTQDIFPFQVYNTARLQYSKSP